MRAINGVLLTVILAGCGGPGAPPVKASGLDVQPAGQSGAPVRGLAASASARGHVKIRYHGGPLILGTTRVYYIWYGNWSGSRAPSILTGLATHLGGSPYFNINTTYFDREGEQARNDVRYGGSTTDSYSQGTSLADDQFHQVVASAISSGNLPLDPNSVYFVLTSADVTASSGFCTLYCGWHTYGSMSGQKVKYAFVGNPDRCPEACTVQTRSPNGDAGADGMASIIAHELEETVTDPELDAWYDRDGYENADKCAWTFGTTYPVANGSQANMKLGDRDYLIQQNWVNANGGYCAKELKELQEEDQGAIAGGNLRGFGL